MAINYKDVRFPASSEILSGRFVSPATYIGPPNLLFLHGGRRASKDRSLPLAMPLAEVQAISSFAFVFSGHGWSTGRASDSSLFRRLQEADAALSHAGFIEPVALCGFSMGAQIALDLLATKAVRSLILIGPMIYPPEVHSLPFGSNEFSSIARRPDSWQSAAVFPLLAEFSGKLLILVGEHEKPTPKEMAAALLGSATQAAERQLVVVPGAGHQILSELGKNDDLLRETCTTIRACVS